ncbi:hypothetical protein A3K34_02090 [candidate division WWE3 bacterium RIFOXYC1_FULL_40_10]|uniref:HMA domain-containing protein n=1 Tax=candidate division WWE3 bacterium RIFOXYA2_FULL_46_9 TaxID=1802636 RepID=A0A1F4VZX4_UNCKA|nr:MAG: hypothetical protein A3K58_02090 [candidate division WWE3 bacterium RIFOXYB1_FULL_40_22]OGC61645.1 MAG: hypothetical protein A3K37_02090 [candidate division WWE3 bacterium RIFOXYA1_FULL_40_11]OGC62650.1 MAG: hypothetical protein A2264_02125 [candidate division WWE3 bacterium RIFOXYA2_FULL_46_9]OGC66028.1 MAG: hypothetical protein A3K34_02090 [candidate division WWE3 bacterium RIFOXYC1_FULL_40_10]OGC67177.1 MAG: hypothetical protein A2450_04910 [candidate division WWE3 bacterium RIFOXYC2
MNNKSTDTNTYYVQGMHCPSCELLIEKTLKEEGYKGVEASLSRCEVTLDGRIDVDSINSKLRDLGYKISRNKPEEPKITEAQLFKAFVIFVFLITGFLYVERSGLLKAFNVNSTSSLGAFFIFGMVAGVSSCAALVGGLLLSLSKKWQDLYGLNSKKSYTPFVLFNIGRLVSYAAFGFLLGLIGKTFQISLSITALLTLAVSAVMIVLGLQMMGFNFANKFNIKTPKFASFLVSNDFAIKSKYVPFLIGAGTFFIPCGFTLVTQTIALASGNPITGSLILLAFALGTLPMLTFVSFSSLKLYNHRGMSKLFGVIAGSLVVFFAINTLNSQLNVLGLKSFSDLISVDKTAVNTSDTKAVDVDSSGTQILRMEASGFEYSPKNVTLKAGIPVRWEFNNKGAVGCSRSVSARGLYPSIIQLNPGMNVFEFTPKTPGTYKITCSMGMVQPVTVVVN